MQKVTMTMRLEKYVAYATLSVAFKGKIVSRTYDMARVKEPINHTKIKILQYGLSRLTESVELTFILPPGYLSVSLQALEKWNDNGYVTGKGKEVKYAGEWKAIHKILERHKYSVEVKENQ